MKYQQHSKPKKIYLNYNLLKREFQTERTIARTRISSQLDYHTKQSTRNSLLSLSMDQRIESPERNIPIKNCCYLFYVDQNGINERLKFKMKPILRALTKKSPCNLLNEQTYKLFSPYSTQSSFPKSQFEGEQFSKLLNVQQVIDRFHQLKIQGDEYQLQQMFNYFYVPSRQLATQILEDLKFQLSKDINKPVQVISFFNGIEIKNACQLGWNPPTLLCYESQEILLKQLPKIQESQIISKKLKQLQYFKQNLRKNCFQKQHELEQNSQQMRIMQKRLNFQKEYDFSLPKLVVQNIYPKFKLIQPNILENEEDILKPLNLEMINEIKQLSSKIGTYDIYNYYIDFKSLCMINPKKNGVLLEHFVLSNDQLKQHTQEELLKIYNAIGVEYYKGIFRWKEYSNYRILQDNLASPIMIMDFLISYFMYDNQTLDQNSISNQLYSLSSRLNNKKQIESSLQNFEEYEGNTFSDRFTITIINWMLRNNFFINGQLNKDIMLLNFNKFEYIFLFIINCILGQFKCNVLEWFYNIYQ